MSSYDFKSKEGVDIGVSFFNLGVETKVTYEIKELDKISSDNDNKNINLTFHEPLNDFLFTCQYLANSCMAYNNPKAYVNYVINISRGLAKKEKNGQTVKEFYFYDWDSAIKDRFCFYGGDLEHIKISLTPDLKELKWEVSIPKESLMLRNKFLEENNSDSIKSIHEKELFIEKLPLLHRIKISQSNIIRTSMFLLSSQPFADNDPRYIFIEMFRKEENEIENNLTLIDELRQMTG